MEVLVRWISFALGAAIVITTIGSIINTIIIPRMTTSRITYVTWLAVYRTFRLVADRRPGYEDKDRILTYLGPVALLIALLGWLLLFLIGYALLFWPLIDGDLGTALKLSGSSIFTLGVASSPHAGPIALEFAAATTGLITVALQIGYLPTIYGAYNRRETLVTALSSRAGAPAWGPEVLARHQLSLAAETLPALYAAWEAWAADIAESHSSYPWLMSFRSPTPRHSWVISLLAVLDSAALYLALAPDRAPPEARQCLRMGFVGVRTLAHVLRLPIDDDPRPDAPITLTYAEFAYAVEHMRAAGFPIERTTEEAWPDFRGWRVNYEAAVYTLADFILAVPAPWSGQRARLSRAAGRVLLPERPRHRTPADPEGRLVDDIRPLPVSSGEQAAAFTMAATSGGSGED